MTILKIRENLDFKITDFENIYDLYNYLEENFILPDLQFKSIENMTFEEKKELEKAKKDNSNLINI